MHNKDKHLEITARIAEAAKNGDNEAFTNGLNEMCENIESDILEVANSAQASTDSTILAQRGIRQLTSDEKKFYENFIDAAKNSVAGARMALSDVDKVFPETIIEATMDDMVQNHPLLSAVDTMNVTGLTRILLNTDQGGAAAWGALGDTITKEIESGFKEIDLTQSKLSCFIPISQDMLALGPVWLDTYIRTCLSEAMATGLETAIVTGTGKSQPIGMDRQIQTGVSVTGGVYPQKEAVAVTDLGRSTYGNLVSKLVANENGKIRTVDGLIMVVSPSDYYKIVMPATTLLTPNGGYVPNVLPVPTQIIQSVAVTEGKAVLGMGKRYFLGVGGNRGVQFSDDYKFIEDQRYYKTVMYATGRAKDNNDFLLLDISKLAPTYLEVKQVATT